MLLDLRIFCYLFWKTRCKLLCLQALSSSVFVLRVHLSAWCKLWSDKKIVDLYIRFMHVYMSLHEQFFPNWLHRSVLSQYSLRPWFTKISILKECLCSLTNCICVLHGNISGDLSWINVKIIGLDMLKFRSDVKNVVMKWHAENVLPDRYHRNSCSELSPLSLWQPLALSTIKKNLCLANQENFLPVNHYGYSQARPYKESQEVESIMQAH